MHYLSVILTREYLKSNARLIESRLRKLIQVGFLDLLFSQIFVQGGSYILQILVATMVGAADFAPIKVAETWIALAILPAAFGMPTSVIKYVAEKRYPDDVVLSHVLAITIVSSHIVILSVFAFVGIFSSDIESVFLIRILIWSLFFSVSTRTILAYFQGLKKIKRAARINTIAAITGLIITVGLTYIFDVKGWLVGRFLSEVFFAIGLFLLIRKKIHFRQWNYNLSSGILRLGFFSMLSLLVVRITTQGDVLLLAFFVEDRALIGSYGLASILRFGLILPVGTIAAIMLPYLVGKLQHSLSHGLIFFLQMIGIALFLLAIIATVVFLFPNHWFVAIFGDDYLQTLQYVRWLLPAIIFGALLTFMNNFLVAFNRTDLAFYILLIGLGINMSLNIWLIPVIGVVGVIIGANVTYGFEVLFQALALAILVRKEAAR